MTHKTTIEWFDGDFLAEHLQNALNAWILGGSVPVGARSTLVVGAIRWLRVLDQPQGPLTDAFNIRCFHYQGLGDSHNPEPFAPVLVEHDVNVWEGPHDERYFRVSFSTFSAPAQGWTPQQRAEGKDHNIVEVQLSGSVTWKNNIFSGRGTKGCIPERVTFPFPGFPLLLQSEVYHFPYSANV